MPSTFSQILLHYVFAVKHREACLKDDFREELHKYISGIVRKSSNKLIAIGSIEDHMHILIGLHPSTAPSDLIRDIKSNSSRFIRESKFVDAKFEWQDGYGVFSHSYDQRNAVIHYIERQREHHSKKPFQTEFKQILHRWGVVYDERYLFEWIAD